MTQDQLAARTGGLLDVRKIGQIERGERRVHGSSKTAPEAREFVVLGKALEVGWYILEWIRMWEFTSQTAWVEPNWGREKLADPVWHDLGACLITVDGHSDDYPLPDVVSTIRTILQSGVYGALTGRIV